MSNLQKLQENLLRLTCLITRARLLGLNRLADRYTQISEDLRWEILKEKERQAYIQASQELQRFYNERRAKK